MNRDILIAFVVGIFTHKLQSAIGNVIIDPVTTMIKNDIENWPTVAHYLNKHEGRSLNCHECTLGTPTNVDGLS